MDLDGVVFDWSLGVCTALQMHGYPIDIRRSDSWDEIQKQISREAWGWVWSEGTRYIFESSPVYSDTVKGLRQMQTFMDLAVMTVRPRSVIDITLRRLADLGLRPIQVFHIQNHEDKTKMAADCIGYVDDRVENVYALSGAHKVPVFMPRRPWNRQLHKTSWIDPDLDIRPYDEFSTVVEWATHYVAQDTQQQLVATPQ